MLDEIVLPDSDIHVAIQSMQYTGGPARNVVTTNAEVAARRTDMASAELTLAQMLDDMTAHFHIHQVQLNFIQPTVEIGA